MLSPLVLLASLGLPVSCAGPDPAHDAPTTRSTSIAARRRAHVVEPCGRALLELDDGRVVAVAGASPWSRLRLHVYRTPLLVDVVETGAVSDDAHCGAYPVVKVVAFAPDGPVERTFSAGALDGELHAYVEDLPRDRFVPQDFEDGPDLPMLDADRCSPSPSSSACAASEVHQTNSDGASLCCPLL